MANIPLKTIKFPGLDDTYTVPQIDSSFTGVAGEAPDSSKVKGEISSLKEDLNAVVEDVIGRVDYWKNIELTKNKYINDSGVEASSVGSCYTNPVPLDSGTYYMVYTKSTTTGNFRVHGYKNGAWVKKIYGATRVETDKVVEIVVDDSIDSIVVSYFMTNTVISSLTQYTGTVEAEIEQLTTASESLGNAINRTVAPDLTYALGVINGSGIKTNYRYRVISSLFEVKSGDYIDVDSGYTANLTIYSAPKIHSSVFVKQISMSGQKITADANGYGVVQISSNAEWSGPTSVVLPDTSYSEHMQVNIITSAFDAVDTVEDDLDRTRTYNDATELFSCLRDVAKDWHFPFIDTTETGFGANHQIPNTATTWSQSGTKDLTQKDTWMSDGTHLYRGVGTTDIYGLTIAQQLALVSPSFHDGEVSAVAPYWTGKRFLWMGTSIPAGSDPEAGEGTGATYPQLVATYLGATVTNIARGSSCVRANASDGAYTGFYFSHFLRSFTRMVDEADAIEDDWASIYPNIANAPSSLSAEQIQTMKNLSFENLLVPYLDGTNTAPDLYVIDYGHNDVRPKGIDGKSDLWIKPTVENIQSGLLAEDTYMTVNNYANLKLAFNSDLSGITDLSAFAASVNRNCLQGALNFLITVILSYKPYARIAIVSDYN